MPDKRLVCEVCCRTFKANFTLRRHVRQSHPETRLPEARRGRKPNAERLLITCTLCDEKFASERHYGITASISTRRSADARRRMSNVNDERYELWSLTAKKVRALANQLF